MKIYAFADEASPIIDEQIKAMKENGVDGLEIRNVDVSYTHQKNHRKGEV